METNKEDNQIVDQFDEFKILRYRFDEFKQLKLNQKKLLFYLSNAALSGRDIIYDQNYKFNLLIRKSLESIFSNYPGNRNHDSFTKFHNYLKKIWFANGIHHPYSKEKIKPSFSPEYLRELIDATYDHGLNNLFTTKDKAFSVLYDLLFNNNVAPVVVSFDTSRDMVRDSAVNFYEGIDQQTAEEFYNKKSKENPKIPFGLNTKLVLDSNEPQEVAWYKDGMYGAAIKEIIYWLEKAIPLAENEKQSSWLKSLIQFYKTGDLDKFNQYNITWVQDTQSNVDLINGFIETYSDPLGIKGTWESILHKKDEEATKRTKILSEHAQWFEDHAPVMDKFKKEKVTGVSATVVNVVMLGGESHPTSPIGVNLPNADWIRKEYGSKSITLNNISLAHHQAMKESGLIEEFAYSKEEVERNKKFGFEANNLHTDLHECLGHGSGKLLEGITSEMLKNYQAPIEEARADLFALYYMMDNKLIDLGILPSLEAAKAQYESYIRNGLMTQLVKVEPGKNLEQAHMRNRQLISLWCYEKGQKDNVIERKSRNGKTFFVIHSFEKLRSLFGELLGEIQRIKSEGDYTAAKNLTDKYGTTIDQEIHKEVLKRFEKLNIPPFSGFMNPEYEPVKNENGEITDIKIKYPQNYTEQMINYSKKYSFLSVDN
jgi:dipeptidyl-peptidase-3